jgi:hypothetical protein
MRSSSRGVRALAVLLALAGCGKSHDLSTEQLSRVVAAGRPALKVCYDDALEKFPFKAEMRMDAILHIAPNGHVKSVDLEGGKGLPGMQDCLRAQIKGWQFPQAGEETATRLPLVFKPEVVKTHPDLHTLEELLKKTQAEK